MTDTPTRREIVEPILRELADYLGKLSDNEFTRFQNNARQTIIADGLRIEIKVQTSAAKRAEFDAISRSRTRVETGKPAAKRDIAAAAAEANAAAQPFVPMGGLERTYETQPVKHDQNAETREAQS